MECFLNETASAVYSRQLNSNWRSCSDCTADSRYVKTSVTERGGYDKMKKIMTPGPTQVRENVRMSRSLATTNPDLDLEFYEYYKDLSAVQSLQLRQFELSCLE